MAAFNTITVERLIACPRCGHAGAIRLQFAYGDTRQHEYGLNDTILWGGNDVGIRSDHAEVLAYPEHCPVCGLETTGEYLLVVDRDRLSTYRLAGPEDVARLEVAD
jgi:hypothetical protein